MIVSRLSAAARNMTFYRLLSVSLLAFLAAGCLGTMPYDGAVSIVQINDVEGPADVVFIHMHRVAGFEEGEYTLTLPSDWKVRPVTAPRGGVATLAQKVTPEWKRIGEIHPERRHSARLLGEPIPWHLHSEGRKHSLPEATEIAWERERLNQDTYWLGPIAESGDPATWTCDMLGARPRVESAAPLAGQTNAEREIEWVHICTFEFNDSRTAMKRRLLRVRNEVVTGFGLLIFFGVPAAVWVLILI